MRQSRWRLGQNGCRLLASIHSSPVGWLTDGDNDTRYYVLIAACVLAQKSVWIRNACLAAALLLPAVAAVHAIVLAALHVDGK